MRLKSLLAMLLAILMTLSFCACGGGVESESESVLADTDAMTDTDTETETEANIPVSTVDEVGNGNHVMIFVMGRERTTTISGSYATWNNQGEVMRHNPDWVTEDGLRDIASVLYPSIGLYDITDPDYQEYMMQLCKMCYIDTINYYVSSTEDVEANKTFWGKSFDSVTKRMLQKYGLFSSARLEKPGTRVSESKVFSTISDAFTAILDKLGDTVLKIDGRPVLAQFSMEGVTSTEAREWKEDYAATHGGVAPFLMTRQDGSFLSNGWPQVSDGQFGWVELDDQANFLNYQTNVGVYRKYISYEAALANHDKIAARAKQYANLGIIPFYSESVTPSFDDVGCWGWGTGPRKVEGGENGALYEYKWQSAVQNQFPMVTIPTWDDWGEATTIEPSLQYGTDYLEITRKYAAEYKGIEANTASLELPGWIYKIRKSTTNKEILAVMDAASDLIAQSRYDEAEALVRPYVESTGIPATSKEFFNFPTTPTTPMPSDVPIESKDPVVTGEKETHYPVADTYVVYARSGGRDAGNDTQLKLKRADATNLSRNMYLKFDLTETSLTAISKATIRLYCEWSTTRAEEIAGRDINLYASATDWEEMSFSWSSQPALGEKIADVDTTSYRNGMWVEIDVTEYVKAHLGEVISFAFRNEGADTENNHLEFSSREVTGKEPQLVIE